MVYAATGAASRNTMSSKTSRWQALRQAWTGGGPRLPPRPEARPVHDLGMATVVKDEGRYLDEWIRFHSALGVERFFIYDNGSTDDTPRVLRPHIEAGRVSLIPWRHFDVFANTQNQAYAHAVANLGPSCRWIGFFDVDEFVFPLGGESLPEFLAPRAHVPALGVVGFFFGTSGHAVPPGGGVVENYTSALTLEAQKRFPKLLNIKCFVQPAHVAAARSAHYFELTGTDTVAFSEHGAELHHFPRDEPERLTADLIRYNHYFTRSAAEFERKRVASDVRGARARSQAEFRGRLFEVIEREAVPDATILPVAQRLTAAEGRGV